MHDEIAKPDDVKWPKNALAYLSTIKRSQEQLTHRAKLAEEILLAQFRTDGTLIYDDEHRQKNAEFAVKQADALIAALERE